MIKQNKAKILLSSAVILLPAVYGIIMWNHLPDTMAVHWGADGITDGTAGKALAVFGLPLLYLLVHLFCLWLTLRDQEKRRQSRKALEMMFWILPACSLVTSGILYRAASGKELGPAMLVPVLLGILFLWVGNYFPKLRRNRTLGIKVSWTIGNEENWNRTHRFAGKVWVCGGLLLLISAMCPLQTMAWVMVCVVAALGLLPIAYSYAIFRQDRKAGVVYDTAPKTKAEKIASKITAVTVPVILLGAALLLFTGSMKVTCGENALMIEASYWPDLRVEYSKIDTVEYRGDFDPGVRTNGFGSPKLSMGAFRNGEFGNYTLYAYTNAKEYIVLTSGGKTLVIGMDDEARTQAIYETLLEKTGKR